MRALSSLNAEGKNSTAIHSAGNSAATAAITLHVPRIVVLLEINGQLIWQFLSNDLYINTHTENTIEFMIMICHTWAEIDLTLQTNTTHEMILIFQFSYWV